MSQPLVKPDFKPDVAEPLIAIATPIEAHLLKAEDVARQERHWISNVLIRMHEQLCESKDCLIGLQKWKDEEERKNILFKLIKEFIFSRWGKVAAFGAGFIAFLKTYFLTKQ